MDSQELRLDQITLDARLQQRMAVNDEVVQSYVENIEDLPPVTVFFDGVAYWLTDGFHRYHAHRIDESTFINAHVINGTRREAMLFAVSANAKHGLHRTSADKRKAVETLLADEEWRQNSVEWIANTACVSWSFAEKIIRQTIGERETVSGKNGKVYQSEPPKPTSKHNPDRDDSPRSNPNTTTNSDHNPRCESLADHSTTGVRSTPAPPKLDIKGLTGELGFIVRKVDEVADKHNCSQIPEFHAFMDAVNTLLLALKKRVKQ